MKLSFILSAMPLLAGCQTAKPIYSWGHYDKIVYQSYTQPGKASPEEQIEELKQDIERAKAQNLPVHPGLHAQLGYLYYQMGKAELAQREFEAEKTLFPESAHFIERMLKSGKQASATP